MQVKRIDPKTQDESLIKQIGGIEGKVTDLDKEGSYTVFGLKVIQVEEDKQAKKRREKQEKRKGLRKNGKKSLSQSAKSIKEENERLEVEGMVFPGKHLRLVRDKKCPYQHSYDVVGNAKVSFFTKERFYNVDDYGVKKKTDADDQENQF